MQSAVFYLNSQPKIVANLIAELTDSDELNTDKSQRVSFETIKFSLGFNLFEIDAKNIHIVDLVKSNSIKLQINIWQSLMNADLKLQKIVADTPILNLKLNGNIVDLFNDQNQDNILLDNSIIKITNGSVALRIKNTERLTRPLNIKQIFIEFNGVKKFSNAYFGFEGVKDSKVSVNSLWQTDFKLDGNLSIKAQKIPVVDFYQLFDDDTLFQKGFVAFDGKFEQQTNRLKFQSVLSFSEIVLKTPQYPQAIVVPDFNVNLTTHTQNNHIVTNVFAQLPKILDQNGFTFNAKATLKDDTLVLTHSQFNLKNLNYSLIFINDHHTRNFLNKLYAAGNLQQIKLQLSTNAPPKLNATFEKIAIAKTSKNLGLDNLSGTIALSNNILTAELDSDELQLNVDSFKPLNIGEFHTKFRIKITDGSPTHIDGTFLIDGQFLSTDSKFQLDFTNNQPSPIVNLSGKFHSNDISGIRHFIPNNTSKKLHHFLSAAFKSGQITDGKLNLAGDLNRYPFKNKTDGKFLLAMKINNWHFDFDDKWHPIKNFDGTLQMDNQKLTVALKKGTIGEATIKNLSATVNDILANTPVLLIKSKLKSDLKAVSRVLLASPIRDTVGRSLNALNFHGVTNFDLNLKIPFDDNQKNRINGTVFFDKNSMYFDTGNKVGNIKLSDIKGVLNFNENRVNAKNITARTLGGKLTIDIHNVVPFDQKNSQLKVGFSGNVEAEKIKQWAPFPLPKISGNIPIDGIIKIANQKNQLSLNLDFKQSAFYLPNIINKPKNQKLLITVNSLWNDKNTSYDFSVGNILIGKLNNDVTQLTGGIATKNIPLVVSKDNLLISVDTDLLIIGLWEKWLNNNLKSVDKSVKRADKNYQKISLRINTKKAKYGQTIYRFLKADVGNNQDGWTIRLIAPKISGDIFIPNDKPKPIVVKLSKFIFGGGEKLSKAATKNKLKNKIVSSQKKFISRSINIDIASLVLGNQKIGSISFRLESDQNGSTIKDIVLKNNAFRISGLGRWQGNIKKTNLSLVLSGKKLQSILQKFSYTGRIEEAETTAKMQLNWHDTPDNFSLNSVNGTVDITIKSGVLSDIEPNTGKIIGFFSIKSLLKKLTLDFSDVTTKGMIFDSIKGKFLVKNGVAKTKDTTIFGNVVAIKFKGTTNLATQDMDFSVMVSPNISNALPAISSIATGGAAAGLLISIYNNATDGGFDKNLATKYRLTGTWGSPRVQKKGSAINEKSNKKNENSDTNDLK